MRHYTERDLIRYENLVAEAHGRVLRQRALIEQLTDPDRLDAAFEVWKACWKL
jgi:hypothetical protein